jgi:hypothetical protein
MYKHDASEQAYKNGYSAGYEAGRRSVGEQKWIPVTERLPEKWQHVLAASKCGDVYSIDFDHICSNGEWYGNLETEYKVTHWMPLPEPPNCGADMRGEEDAR